MYPTDEIVSADASTFTKNLLEPLASVEILVITTSVVVRPATVAEPDDAVFPPLIVMIPDATILEPSEIVPVDAGKVETGSGEPGETAPWLPTRVTSD